MFSHVMIGTNDIDRAKAFYDAVLATLGASPAMINEAATGHKRAFYFHGGGIFAISEPINDQPATVANGSTIGFACDSLEQVQAFHDAAVAAGGTSIEDPPGPRSGAMGTLNLAYVLDPDGHKLCMLHRAG
ncbi:VOC family protein [Erythrobacter sanguineus]|uniref:Catechol 2,3-dioxygenase n=1 Tax=Erythrobacter sanguineus TaxID=198312 RepID=A0A1M7SYU6_9SPHN|nr:VOC family protein [Erythrobacter sanguineus]MCR9179312.1 VOC family protein [Erythrobacteraceae bacterium]SHN63662.1 Catechol 2,3-dioxygenase [Erythrobacter sanguineus]